MALTGAAQVGHRPSCGKFSEPDAAIISYSQLHLSIARLRDLGGSPDFAKCQAL
jgi:hypothetical protein